MNSSITLCIRIKSWTQVFTWLVLWWTMKASDTLEYQPMVWPVPYACAQPYRHPGSGSHGQLFWLTRPKQLSMIATAWMIWLCACVRYRPLVGVYVTCLYCLVIWWIAGKNNNTQKCLFASLFSFSFFKKNKNKKNQADLVPACRVVFTLLWVKCFFCSSLIFQL